MYHLKTRMADSSLTLDPGPRSWLWLPPAVTIPYHPNTAQKLSYRNLFTSYRKVKAKESGEARNEFFRHQPHCVVHCTWGQPKSFTLSQAYLTSWVLFLTWQDLNQHFWVYPKAFCDLNTGWPVHVTVAESRSWGPLYHIANTVLWIKISLWMRFKRWMKYSSSGWNSTAGHWLSASLQSTEKDASSTD